MPIRDVEYQVEGLRMVGRLAIPDGTGKRPAILIAHEGNGLDDYQKSRADRFAALGYVAFALDYHGGGVPVGDRDEMMDRLGQLRDDPERIRALGIAGLDILTAEPRTDVEKVAAIGYCIGGTVVLELARSGAERRSGRTPVRCRLAHCDGRVREHGNGSSTTPNVWVRQQRSASTRPASCAPVRNIRP
jgi:dienelactone hydrolase